MKKSLAPIALAAVGLLLCPPAEAAQSGMPMSSQVEMSQVHMAMHMPPQLSVTASGTVDYVPDTARLTLGIRSDSPSATTAVDTINKNAAQVIAAIKALGVPDSSIKTIGYNLFYREGGNMIAAGPAGAIPTSRPSSGSFQASEALAVTTPVGIAGKVLDAAIGAGANESFGLSYQTTKYDALYREALAKAMKSARDTADALAKAAHVSIVEIQSLSNSSDSSGMQMNRNAMASSSASVLPGTDAVTATVYVMYRIK